MCDGSARRAAARRRRAGAATARRGPGRARVRASSSRTASRSVPSRRLDDQHHREAPAEHRHLRVGDVQRVAEQRAGDLGDDAGPVAADRGQGELGHGHIVTILALEIVSRTPELLVMEQAYDAGRRPAAAALPPVPGRALRGARRVDRAEDRRTRRSVVAGRRVVRHPARDGAHHGPARRPGAGALGGAAGAADVGVPQPRCPRTSRERLATSSGTGVRSGAAGS